MREVKDGESAFAVLFWDTPDSDKCLEFFGPPSNERYHNQRIQESPFILFENTSYQLIQVQLKLYHCQNRISSNIASRRSQDECRSIRVAADRYREWIHQYLG